MDIFGWPIRTMNFTGIGQKGFASQCVYMWLLIYSYIVRNHETYENKRTLICRLQGTQNYPFQVIHKRTCLCRAIFLPLYLQSYEIFGYRITYIYRFLIEFMWISFYQRVCACTNYSITSFKIFFFFFFSITMRSEYKVLFCTWNITLC